MHILEKVWAGLCAAYFCNTLEAVFLLFMIHYHLQKAQGLEKGSFVAGFLAAHLVYQIRLQAELCGIGFEDNRTFAIFDIAEYNGLGFVQHSDKGSSAEFSIQIYS